MGGGTSRTSIQKQLVGGASGTSILPQSGNLELQYMPQWAFSSPYLSCLGGLGNEGGPTACLGGGGDVVQTTIDVPGNGSTK